MITYSNLLNAYLIFSTDSSQPSRIFLNSLNFNWILSEFEKRFNDQSLAEQFNRSGEMLFMNAKLKCKKELLDNIILFVGDKDENCGIYDIELDNVFGILVNNKLNSDEPTRGNWR